MSWCAATWQRFAKARPGIEHMDPIMPYSSSSKVLFVSICSLTKAGGGHNGYDADKAISSELSPRLVRKLLWGRERIRQLQAASLLFDTHAGC